MTTSTLTKAPTHPLTKPPAITGRDPAAAHAAIDHHSGELRPDDRYEEWAGERPELLHLRHLHLLRLAGQWLEVTELDPSDEEPTSS